MARLIDTQSCSFWLTISSNYLKFEIACNLAAQYGNFITEKPLIYIVRS